MSNNRYQQNNYDQEGGFDATNQSEMNDDYHGSGGDATQGGSTQRGAYKKGTKKFSNDTKQITPSTVRQLFGAKLAKDDQFEIDGVQVGLVTILGKIVSLVENENLTSYMIDDSTGVIEVKSWSNDNYAKSKRAEWQVGLYVRVYGHLRQWEAKNSLVAFRMCHVSDFNEVTFHMLDVIHSHLLSTKGSLPTVNPREWEEAQNAQRNAGESSTGSGDSSAMVHQQSQHASSVVPQAHPQGNVAKMQDYLASQSDNQSEFDQICEAVLNMVRAHNNTKRGIHINDIYESLNGSYTQDDVAQAINHLGTEGHIYNSVDDYHLKCQ